MFIRLLLAIFLVLFQLSGISKEDFRLIDTIENEYDATTAAALDAVQRRGEMVVRILDPRIHLTKTASDAAKKFLMLQVSNLRRICKSGLALMYAV